MLKLENCSVCARRFPGSLTFCDGGTHGYDNDVESMHVSTDSCFLHHSVLLVSGNVNLCSL